MWLLKYHFLNWLMAVTGRISNKCWYEVYKNGLRRRYKFYRARNGRR